MTDTAEARAVLGPCWYCKGDVLSGEEGAAPAMHAFSREPLVAHRACDAAAKAKARERERKQKIERLTRHIHEGFSDFLGGTWRHHQRLTCPPRWEFARFDNAQFRARASKKIVGAVERWSPDAGSLLISSPTGRGKTAAALAWAFRKRDELLAAALAAPDAQAADKIRLPHLAFVTGPALSGCRRRWQIGEESPLVELATAADILILDEVGFESLSDELFFVIDERYRLEKRSIVTTGLPPDKFGDRYGHALLRRLLEPGALVQDGP